MEMGRGCCHHDKCREGHAGHGHLPATVSDWAGRFGIKGEGGLGLALPHLCRSQSNLLPLLSIPVPQERTSAGLGELEPLLSLLQGSCRVLAHESWAPVAFCAFPRSVLGRCLELAAFSW